MSVFLTWCDLYRFANNGSCFESWLCNTSPLLIVSRQLGPLELFGRLCEVPMGIVQVSRVSSSHLISSHLPGSDVRSFSKMRHQKMSTRILKERRLLLMASYSGRKTTLRVLLPMTSWILRKCSIACWFRHSPMRWHPWSRIKIKKQNIGSLWMKWLGPRFPALNVSALGRTYGTYCAKLLGVRFKLIARDDTPGQKSIFNYKNQQTRVSRTRLPTHSWCICLMRAQL